MLWLHTGLTGILELILYQLYWSILNTLYRKNSWEVNYVSRNTS